MPSSTSSSPSSGAAPLARALPAELRARLSELRIVARRTTAASAVGQHLGRHRGAGLEFEQYRGYAPGDEPRRIDWKLYARSGHFFVRDAVREAPLTVWLLLDATASMSQADLARPDFRKFDAARQIANAVAEIAVRQGDAVGLLIIGGQSMRIEAKQPLTVIPAGGGRRQIDRIALTLAQFDCVDAWPTDATQPSAISASLWSRIAPGHIALLLSDDFDDAALELTERLAATGRDVRSIGLIAADERDFPFDGGCRFEEQETDARRSMDAATARAGFIARFGAARQALARKRAAAGIVHVDHVLDLPLDVALSAALSPLAALR